jgi:hypothetical protein
MPYEYDLLDELLKVLADGGDWGYATAAIANHFWHTNDKTVRRFLASMVFDELRPADLRLAAYYTLHEVAGSDLWNLPDAHVFKIPEDLDKVFLQECLT